MIAICLGGAQSVWSELEQAKALIGDRPHIVGCCNFAGIAYPGHLDFWATLHPERFQPWRDERAAKGLNTDYRAFIYTIKDQSAGEVLPYRWYGSSGLYMAQVALEAMGCDGVILCGVPMDDTGGHIHHGHVWDHAHHYRAAFERAKAENAPIRSMSGWSADLFGRPDEEWLNGLG